MAHPPLTLARAAELLRTRQASSTELTKQCLDRIAAAEPRLGAFLTVTAEHALKQAAAADERLARGENVGPLTGVPYAVKDCLNTTGLRTTAASKILDDYVAPYDATVISRLNAAGAMQCNGVPANPADGWVLKDESTIELVGPACNAFLMNPQALLTAGFPCDVIVM